MVFLIVYQSDQGTNTLICRICTDDNLEVIVTIIPLHLEKLTYGAIEAWAIFHQN